MNLQRFRDGDGDGDGEDGFTLVELLVSMSMLLIVTVIASVAIITLLQITTKTNGYVDAQAATRRTFETIDRQVTYADAITTPYTDGSGSEWISWQVPDPSITPTAPQIAERCYQWKASPSTGTLQYRSWIATTGTVATPAWITVVNGLVASPTPVFTVGVALQASPFFLPSASTATGAVRNQQLGVSLNVSRNVPAGSSAVTSVFTALNTTATASSASVCSQVPEV